jgi:hypothetical protein
MYAHKAGTADTVTVPEGKRVLMIYAWSTAGGTITITPFGGTAQDAIPVPAGGGISVPLTALLNVQGAGLDAGSTLAFASTTAYLVIYV